MIIWNNTSREKNVHNTLNLIKDIEALFTLLNEMIQSGGSGNGEIYPFPG